MQAELLDFNASPCPRCSGTGWELVEGKGVRPCSCKKSTRVEQNLVSARIPERFKNCSLYNFETETSSLARALNDTREWIEEYPLDFGLLYMGTCGVGKTHLAVAALKELIITKGVSGLFYDFRDLLKEIQDSYNPNTHTSELKILAPIFEAEVL